MLDEFYDYYYYLFSNYFLISSYSIVFLALIKFSLNSSDVVDDFNYSLKFFPKLIILVKFYIVLV